MKKIYIFSHLLNRTLYCNAGGLCNHMIRRGNTYILEEFSMQTKHETCQRVQNVRKNSLNIFRFNRNQWTRFKKGNIAMNMQGELIVICHRRRLLFDARET